MNTHFVSLIFLRPYINNSSAPFSSFISFEQLIFRESVKYEWGTTETIEIADTTDEIATEIEEIAADMTIAIEVEIDAATITMIADEVR